MSRERRGRAFVSGLGTEGCMGGCNVGGWSVSWTLHGRVEWARQSALQRFVLQRVLPWRPQVGQKMRWALAAGLGKGGGWFGKSRGAGGGWFATRVRCVVEMVGMMPRSQNLNMWSCDGL
jgi:hypothetical protein